MIDGSPVLRKPPGLKPGSTEQPSKVACKVACKDRQLDRKFVRGGSADALSDGSKERRKLGNTPDLLKASGF